VAYFSPYVDSSGLHIPTYSDIRDQLIADAKSIFGSDIYLESDSMDYQWISSVAAKIYDAHQLMAMVYNNRSPSGAIGTGLDSIVKLNGIKRKSGAFSTVIVTITGTPNTIITNGVVADSSNVKWSLPLTVTIPIGGTTNVTAICQTAGVITALANTITTIVTPTYGWSTVNNASAATVGAAIETDAELRARQTVSVSLPSRTRLEATKGVIAAVSGVTRFIVYENPTSSADSNGITAHSICAVVEGGTDLAVATAIFDNKGPGCGTYGSTTQAVFDAYGQSTDIKLSRPSYKDVDIAITVKALTGYSTAITAQIKSNLAAYLNSLRIGDDISVSSLWGAALTAMPDLRIPMFSITALTTAFHGGGLGTTDLVVAFNEVARGNVSNIDVTVV
jgi:uncharacterized phage protein gp47/JayE